MSSTEDAVRIPRSMLEAWIAKLRELEQKMGVKSERPRPEQNGET